MTRIPAVLALAALTWLAALAPAAPARAGSDGLFTLAQQDPIFIPTGQLKKLRRQLMPGFAPEAAPPGYPAPVQVEPDMPPARLIPESLAVQQAMAMVPDGKPLGVRLLPGPRAVYAVRLRTATQVIRVIVDAETGDVLSQ